jgi:hypothetical protein
LQSGDTPRSSSRFLGTQHSIYQSLVRIGFLDGKANCRSLHFATLRSRRQICCQEAALFPAGIAKALCALGFVGRESEPQISPLRYPGFPVEVSGVVELHAPFSNGKAHTWTCPVQRNRKSGYASVETTNLWLSFRPSIATTTWNLPQSPHPIFPSLQPQPRPPRARRTAPS